MWTRYFFFNGCGTESRAEPLIIAPCQRMGYGHAICFFAARPHVALELHEALVQYRLRLMEFSHTYYFNSIRTYHYAFMAKRILRG